MNEPIDATFDLTGRKALVTGASRGIGEAIALGLARFGADVAVTARDVVRLAEVSAEIEAQGRRAVPVAMDAADVAAIRSGVAEAAMALGGLDLLVNNAGMEEVCASLEVEELLLDRIHETNLKGAFFTAQAAARMMREAAADKQGGTILNVCSLTSAVGVPTAAPYGASKAGPARAGPARWPPMPAVGHPRERHWPRLLPDGADRDLYADEAWQLAMLAKIPAGCFGDRRDLVGASVFLSSDAARYVTGQILDVDGGYMASI